MRYRAAIGAIGIGAVTTGTALALRRPGVLLHLMTRAMRIVNRPPREFGPEFSHRPYPKPAPPPLHVRAFCDVREDRIDDQVVYTLTPKRHRSKWHIIYTHGGAYVFPLLPMHWNIVTALMQATGATVTLPEYPLAPEHTYTETYRELEQVYRGVLQRVPGEQIILCGDSAGGGIALGQAMYFRDQGLPPPAEVILFSPSLDVTISDPESSALERRDPILRIDFSRGAGEAWAGLDDPRSPLVSPLFGNLHDLPPIQVYYGTEDILAPQSRRLREAVTAAGGRVDAYETPGGFHVFVAATLLPEAKRVFRQIRRHLGDERARSNERVSV